MDLRKHINTERRDFEKSLLEEAHLIQNPFEFFKQWLEEAIEKNVNEANAFCLSTCVDNKPSSRIVYIRDFVNDGIVFYTNYKSRKGEELDKNPNASINFFWPEFERQIRAEGTIKKLSNEISDAYFASRPRESQIGAWASAQSKVLVSRDLLEKEMEMIRKQFENKEVTRPDYWGGYIFQPTYFEFWQGRKNRLHDRFAFEKENTQWKINRLFP
jgi:pyridoxamine 5'-phosphate oxidase